MPDSPGALPYSGLLVFADVYSQNAVESPRPADVVYTFVYPGIVDSHVVDEGLLRNAAKEPGFGISGLWARSQCADFHKSESQMPEGAEGVGFFVHSCGKPHTVREFQPHDRDRIFHGCGEQSVEQVKVFCNSEPLKGYVVSRLRVEEKQKLFSKLIKLFIHDSG